MSKSISAAAASRNFSKLLRDVKEGKSYVVTSHGKPIARIVPVVCKKGHIGNSQAWKVLMNRLRNQSVIDIGRWTRDALYNRD
jgi:prevent-host-death family protein